MTSTAPAQISILAIGAELMNGKISDSNSAYIASKIKRSGINVISIRLVTDEIAKIEQALIEASKEANYIVCTGGLGPTSDDLTRQGIAKFARQELIPNAESQHRLQEYLSRRNRRLSAANNRQTFFPSDSLVIPNSIGTADAFETAVRVSGNDCYVLALPGVPREMKYFVDSYLISRLENHFINRSIPKTYSYRLFGISEADLGEKIESLSLDQEIIVSYRPQFPEILLEIAAQTERALQLIDDCNNRIANALGNKLIVSDKANIGIPQVASGLLKAKGLTLSCSESCSGGMLADLLVSQAGASSYFLSSVVSYSNKAKIDILGVASATIEQFGAVSQECALEMARGIRKRTSADYSLSITGTAGPEGGTEEKPVGTVWVACKGPKVERVEKLFLPWNREMIRSYSCYYALSLLIEELEK